jgi:hypothetical protein
MASTGSAWWVSRDGIGWRIAADASLPDRVLHLVAAMPQGEQHTLHPLRLHWHGLWYRGPTVDYKQCAPTTK